MTQHSDIRLRPDGSIDTAYYMEIGRQRRSEQAHDIARSLVPARRRRQARIMEVFEGLFFQRA